MKAWLLDTGPLVAYVDRGDPHHAGVSAALDRFEGRVVTTSAVVTEAMHLVAEAPTGPRLLAELLRDARAETHDFSRPSDLAVAVTLMERYAAVPMDHADATLLLLAEATGINHLATLDRRGFSAFRTRAGRALRLVLDA